ncbi:hypothetical protein MGEO_20260 [Marivita geojedonensis]|uniref:Uncharacterized protein n=1 Tax=Marivita geojedonensis TaxID=1123756 RepID=A0A1X4N8Z4_9RHOB|nr:hypothetical protein MGEO_20260 [Marivita geojedonensis]PRY71827.1 hypothetical protein CLV76_1406 [Marivita geojedonensis]
MDRRYRVQRRVLIRAYQKYLASERAFEDARRSALMWFPGMDTRHIEPIGNPGSLIRQLYDRRERAIARLRLAQKALDDAQSRLTRRRSHQVLLITR